jgi:hypothetical protein
MTYVEKIYGHPGQTQPAHIVVMSNRFDTREVQLPSKVNKSNRLHRIKEVPIDKIVQDRDQGDSYYRIGKRYGFDPGTIRFWYLQAKKENGESL